MARCYLPEYPLPEDLKKVLKMLDKQDHNGIMSENAKAYMKVLQKLETAKCIQPSETHYFQLLKMALYLEEYQGEIDMKKYDLNNKIILKTDADIFRISTDEWHDEERPMIRINDLIDIIDTRDRISYGLRVVNVTQTLIEARSEKFLERYSRTKRYDIRFRYQNYPKRCNHFALCLTNQHKVITYLFPGNFRQSLSAASAAATFNSDNILNSAIKTNKEQVQAVLNILSKSSYPRPYILYGPPGTGKTATIVEAICQIILQDTENRVLVCTPSNTASDEVTKRLLGYIKPEFVYRMYSGSKEPSTIDQQILSCCNYVNGKIDTFIKLEDVSRKRIIITTLCNCTKLILIGLPRNHFSHVIIDEAGQSIEPDILIPVSLVSRNGTIFSQIVLAGDPKQLGPVVMSKRAEIILGRSILERLMTCPIYKQNHNGKYNPNFITKLLINYRSHPKIISISNELFYNSELIPRSTMKVDKFPVIFYGTRKGREEKCSNSTSSCNRQEIDMVLNKIQKLLRNKNNHGLGEVTQEDIGIVTPFKLQSKEIKKALIRRNLKDINVGTVELFQGQEKKIIIISAVRTRIFPNGEFEHIGSLSNPKRFNVAVTRAKDMLIIIGDSNALQIDASWRYLLEYCINNNSAYDVRLKLKPLKKVLPDNSNKFAEEFVLSSYLFEWRKFNLFKLDESDSNAAVQETIKMILYPKPAPPIPIQVPMSRPMIPIQRPINTNRTIPVKKEKKRCIIL